MLRTLLALSLVVLLLAPSASAGAPNARSPDFDAGAPIEVVAMGVDSGHLLVGTQDQGSRVGGMGLGGGPDLDVWYFLDAKGELILSGSADYISGSTNCVSRLQDDCTAPVTAGAVSPDGRKYLIGSQLTSSLADAHRGQIMLGDKQSGIQDRRQYPDIPVAIGFGNDSKEAISLHRVEPAGGGLGGVGDDSSMVRFHDIDATLSSASQEAVAIPGVPVGLAVAGSGIHGAVATTNGVYRVAKGVSTAFSHTGSSSTPTAIGMDLEGELAVAGYSNGDVAAFLDGVAGSILVRKPGSAITDVAVAPDGAWFVAGDSSGQLHLFSRKAGPGTVLEDTVNLGTGPVHGLSWGSDSHYLSGAVGGVAFQLDRRNTTMASLWVHNGTTIETVAMRGNGDQVAVARGNNLTVFQALHQVTATPLGLKLNAQDARNISLEYRNTGNRPETVELAADFPSGWFFALETTNLSLDVGQSKKVYARLVTPTNATPGDTVLRVLHTLDSGGAGTTPITVSILENRLVVIVAEGPDSSGISPGGVANYKLIVRNAGNVPTESQLRTTMSPDGWIGSLGQTRFELQPGARAETMVKIQAPSDAKEGDRGTLLVTMDSDKRRAASFSATVGASFQFTLDVPRAVAAPAGNLTIFNATISNTGNAPDSYQLTLDNQNLPEGWDIGFGGAVGEAEVRLLSPGQQETLPIHVKIPSDAPSSAILNLKLTAKSLAEPTNVQSKPIVLSIAEGDAVIGGDRDQPAAPIAGILLVLASIVAVQRRDWNRKL